MTVLLLILFALAIAAGFGVIAARSPAPARDEPVGDACEHPSLRWLPEDAL